MMPHRMSHNVFTFFFFCFLSFFYLFHQFFLFISCNKKLLSSFVKHDDIFKDLKCLLYSKWYEEENKLKLQKTKKKTRVACDNCCHPIAIIVVFVVVTILIIIIFMLQLIIIIYNGVFLLHVSPHIARKLKYVARQRKKNNFKYSL